MKKIIFIILYILLFNSVKSQTFEWAKQAGGKASDGGRFIETDKQGNLYIGGSFTDTAFFDNHILNSGDWIESDGFIAKYTNNGNLVWLRQTEEPFNAMHLDGKGNLYVTGTFWGTLAFCPQSNDTLKSTSWDSYIAKYDTAGNFLWVRQIGGQNGHEGITSFAIDSLDNIYIAGSISDAAQFGTSR